MLLVENLIIKDSSGKKLVETSLRIDTGGVFSLIGPGGCGKSVLMRAIAGILDDQFTVSSRRFETSGSVHYFPQKEHAFVRFPTGLQSDISSFFDKYQNDSAPFKLVMLDEPGISDRWIEFLLRSKNYQNQLTILSTHNQEMISDFSEKVIVMKEGAVYKILNTEDFFTSNDNYIRFLIKMGF